VIKLDKPGSIRHVAIENRHNLPDRAGGLTMWVSTDQKKWRQVWQAPSVKSKWAVDLPAAPLAQYIKLGLRRKGTLHLAKVTVFGK